MVSDVYQLSFLYLVFPIKKPSFFAGEFPKAISARDWRERSNQGCWSFSRRWSPSPSSWTRNVPCADDAEKKGNGDFTNNHGDTGTHDIKTHTHMYIYILYILNCLQISTSKDGGCWLIYFFLSYPRQGDAVNCAVSQREPRQPLLAGLWILSAGLLSERGAKKVLQRRHQITPHQATDST